MTQTLLNELWYNFLLGAEEFQRFGQYVYNMSGLDIPHDLYNEPDPKVAYTKLLGLCE